MQTVERMLLVTINYLVSPSFDLFPAHAGDMTNVVATVMNDATQYLFITINQTLSSVDRLDSFLLFLFSKV